MRAAHTKMSVCIYLCNNSEFFVGVEVQSILLPALGRNIKVIWPVQTDRTILDQFLWTNYISAYMKPRAEKSSINYAYQF